MRKSELVTVPKWDGSRDSGKMFLITEMSAGDAEKWAMRMFIALKGNGGELSEGLAKLGIVGIQIATLNAFLRADIDPDVLEPLFDKMMDCVQIVRDPRHPDVVTPLASPDDTEDVRTRIWLRGEILRIHTGFTGAEIYFMLISAGTPKDS